MKEEAIKLLGIVQEVLPGGKFQIELENGHAVQGHLAGKLRKFKIKILPGDCVAIELSPYDLGKGRVTYRYNRNMIEVNKRKDTVKKEDEVDTK